MIGDLDSPIARIGGLKLAGSCWPLSSLMSGLGSKVSRWLGPPSMKRKMTFFARPARPVSAALARVSPPEAASKGDCESAASATAPKPQPAVRRKSRREATGV